MQLTTQLNLVGNSVIGSTRSKSSKPPEQPAIAKTGTQKNTYLAVIDNPSFFPHAWPSEKEDFKEYLTKVKSSLDERDLLNGTQSASEHTAGLEMVVLLEALSSACQTNGRHRHRLDFAAQVIEKIKNIDLLDVVRDVVQRADGRLPVGATEEDKCASAVLWHLANTPVGTALALRLTRQSLEKPCRDNKSFESHLQKLMMYFFTAQKKINAAPPGKSTVYLTKAMEGISRLIQRALEEMQRPGSSSKAYFLGDEIRKLPPDLAMAVGALRNNLDLDDAGSADRPAEHEEVNKALERLVKSLNSSSLQNEGKVRHLRRVMGKVVGGKLGSPLAGMKYLNPECPALNATQLAQQKYQVLQNVISLLAQCIARKRQEHAIFSIANERDDADERPSNHGIPPWMAGGRAPVRLQNSVPALAGPAARGRAAPPSAALRMPIKASAYAFLNDLDPDDDDGLNELIKDCARELILEKFNELIKRNISNLPAAIGIDQGQEKLFGSDVIKDIMSNPAIACLNSDIRLRLKYCLRSFNASLNDPDNPDILTEWQTELQTRLNPPPPAGAAVIPNPVNPAPLSGLRPINLKANNLPDTRQNTVKAFESLANGLHLGYQVALGTQSGHQVSTQGLGALATGGLVDFYAKAGYTKGEKILLGNNSIGSYLDDKWVSSKNGGVGAIIGIPLVRNPAFGISAGLQGELSRTTVKGISLKLNRDNSFITDAVNRDRMKELTKFIIEYEAPLHGDMRIGSDPSLRGARPPSKTLLIALLEKFPDISISLIDEKKMNISGEVSGRLNMGPKTPVFSLTAYANASIKLKKDFNDIHHETLGHNRRDVFTKSWSAAAGASVGIQAGIDMTHLIGNRSKAKADGTDTDSASTGTSNSTSSVSISNANSNSPDASSVNSTSDKHSDAGKENTTPSFNKPGTATNTVITAKGLLHPLVAAELTFHASSIQTAVHVRDGETQSGTSWRMKTFTKEAYLRRLENSRNKLVEEWSKAVVLKSYGELNSAAARELYQERRLAHDKWLTEHIESVKHKKDLNTAYALSYDLTKAAATEINKYRAVEASCRKMNLPQEAQKWSAAANQVIENSKSYVLANLLVIHSSNHGSIRNAGLLVYGKHSSSAEERSFELYGPIPSKIIPLASQIDPDEDEIAQEPLEELAGNLSKLKRGIRHNSLPHLRLNAAVNRNRQPRR